uniref:Uncharacterized protein n=1 Tax=Timema poppense TaxID=170557 RepID=A0A7R9HI02_TIMPO|nr:unnamed protein product [Timema poppensis]
MDTWTLQSGHPVITITRNYISGALTVTQERFYLRRSGDSTDTHDYKWWVPLTYTSNTNRDFLSTTHKNLDGQRKFTDHHQQLSSECQ